MANSYPNYDPAMDTTPESAIPDSEAPMMMTNPVLQRASGRGRGGGRGATRAGLGMSGGRTGLYAGAAVLIVLIGAGAFFAASRMHQQSDLVPAPAVSTGEAPAAPTAPPPTAAETAAATQTPAPSTTESAPPSSAPVVHHEALARNERTVARHETRVARARAAADTGADVSTSAPMISSRSNTAPPPSGPVTMPAPIASQAASPPSAPSSAPVVTPPPPQ